VSSDATFLFADLAGFTALTEAHGDTHAADAAEDFCRRVQSMLGDEDRVVKTIGDAVMVRCGRADAAVNLGLRIVGEFCGRHRALPVRIGMHTGPAIERSGDYYGATVNVAARVAALAAGGEVLLTEATASALAPDAPFELHRHGIHQVRNVGEPLALLRAVTPTETGITEVDIDPVCRMVIDPGRAAGVLEHDGRQYRFCSLECAGSFAQDPQRHIL
jgi:adenylate cyclase